MTLIQRLAGILGIAAGALLWVIYQAAQWFREAIRG